MENIKLSNEIEIPKIGFGTFPMKGIRVIKAILLALKFGYKRIDTASAYGNERGIGIALKLSLMPRNNYFITTKLSNREQENGDIEKALRKSMKRLGVKYIDLYLMHWPNPETYINSWKEMEKLYKKGLVKAIGVCNFHQHHLDKLMKECEIVPMVNQIEITPLLTQEPLIKYCKEKNIIVEAYSPLGRMNEKIKNNDVLKKIANNKNKTISQIILRWNYQKERCFSCKSENMKRIKENIDIFDFKLSKSEIIEIDQLNIDFRIRHNPDNCDFSKL